MPGIIMGVGYRPVTGYGHPKIRKGNPLDRPEMNKSPLVYKFKTIFFAPQA
jgi:hypothetical protein